MLEFMNLVALGSMKDRLLANENLLFGDIVFRGPDGNKTLMFSVSFVDVFKQIVSALTQLGAKIQSGAEAIDLLFVRDDSGEQVIRCAVVDLEKQMIEVSYRGGAEILEYKVLCSTSILLLKRMFLALQRITEKNLVELEELIPEELMGFWSEALVSTLNVDKLEKEISFQELELGDGGWVLFGSNR